MPIDTSAIKPDPRLIAVRVDVTKELSEFGDGIVSFIDDIVDGKSPTDAAVANFGKIQSAIEGSSAIPGEFQDLPEEAIATIGVIAGRIIGAFLRARKAHAAKTLAPTEPVTGAKAS